MSIGVGTVVGMIRQSASYVAAAVSYLLAEDGTSRILTETGDLLTLE